MRRNISVRLTEVSDQATGRCEYPAHCRAAPAPATRSRADGVVFEDANGNGRRDHGEHGVPGVEVTLGYLRATTDASGRFAFRREVEAGSEFNVNVSTLDPSLMLLSTARLPKAGHVNVPVIRQATLQVQVVVTVYGRSVPENLPANGAHLLLRDATGRERELVADERGVAHATGLMPGKYQVTVTTLPRYRAELPKPVQLEVRGGEAASTVIYAVVPPRQILDRTGNPLGNAPGYQDQKTEK